MVVKKNGRRAPFDRDKLMRSVQVALRKRPVEPDRIERMVNGVVRQLESQTDGDIPTERIGELVMEGLKALDDVAYVRFASVYRNFREARDFNAIVGELEAEPEARRRADRRRRRKEAAGDMSAAAAPPRTDEDRRWMQAALNLGERSLGLAAPNPSVGAILVKDGAVVGRGVTAPGGRPHAERIALAEAGEAARGATLYVTLEPCSHFGASPPCADAIVEAGVARVVSAIEDPNPRSAGQGPRPAAGGGNRGHGRARGRSGAARPSRPHSAGHRGPALRDAEARRDGRRLRRRRPARPAAAASPARSPISRADHARDARGDHDRRRDGARRRSGADRAPARPRPQALARRARHASAPAGGIAPRHGRARPADTRHRRAGRAARGGRAARRSRRRRRARSGSTPRAMSIFGQALGALIARGVTRVFSEGGPRVAARLIAQGLADEVVLFTAEKPLGLARPAGAERRGARDARRSRALSRSSETRNYGADVMRLWTRL